MFPATPIMGIWLKHTGGNLLPSFKLVTSLHPALGILRDEKVPPFSPQDKKRYDSSICSFPGGFVKVLLAKKLPFLVSLSINMNIM